MDRDNLKVLIPEQEIQEKIAELAEKLNNKYKNESVFVICVLKGAVLFTIDLVKHLTMPVQMEFIRLSSYGNAQTSSGTVHAIDIKLPDLNNQNVIILEDIVDTGLTAKFLLDYINQNFKVKSLLFCSLLDKKGTRKIEISPDYSCFEIDDIFVAGYGLDYDGYCRNIPYIAYK